MKTLLFVFIVVSANISFSQNTIKYAIHGEAHALMCPFLSPKLMDHLTKKGAVGIYKDENLLVHFTTSKENELSDEIILKIIDEIGYESRNFKITRIYE